MSILRSKTSERWKNARCRPERLAQLNDVCRGIEIATWETNRILRRVTHDEALAILLQTAIAKMYREKAQGQHS